MKRPLRHEAAILQLFASRQRGVKPKDVAAHLGICEENAKFWLRTLRDLGVAAVSKHGGGAVWHTPERIKVLKELAADAGRRRRKDRRKRESEHRRLIATVQRVVPAAGLPMPNFRAPISVFHLAA